MILHTRRALLVAAVLLVCFAVLAVLISQPGTRDAVQSLDDRVNSALDGPRWGPLVWLSRALSVVGGSLVLWPVRALVLAILAWRRAWAGLVAFALAVLTSEALIGPVKAVYNRPRPPGALIRTSGASFPSGHAIASAVTATCLVVVLLPAGPRRRPGEAGALLFAAAVALSRVYLSAHWLSDVLAGFLLGCGLGWGWPALVQVLGARWGQANARAASARPRAARARNS
jgi:undecaprenyl-diphosphatase